MELALKSISIDAVTPSYPEYVVRMCTKNKPAELHNETQLNGQSLIVKINATDKIPRDKLNFQKIKQKL